MTAIFVDTSAWVAILSRDDPHHSSTLNRYRELSASRARLVTSNYVVDETATHLRYGIGLRAALDFHGMILNAHATGRLRTAWVDESAESEAWRILEQNADVKLSLTDASSAALARSARIGEILGLDRDFEALGFTVRPGHD